MTPDLEAKIAKIISSHLYMLDIGCGEDFRVVDAIAVARKDKTIAEADEFLGEVSAWAAHDIMELLK